jgi:hypothetical protein
MTAAVASTPAKHGNLALGAAFAALFALGALELIVLGLVMERAARITTLAGLLMAKVGLVLLFLMRARQSRRSARLLLTAIVFCAGVAVVLMLETAYRVSIT